MGKNTQPSEWETQIKTPCPYACMNLTEVIGLMIEWIRKEAPGLWENAIDTFNSNYRHQNYLCCAKAMIDFLNVLLTMLPDSYHKTLLKRYLAFFNSDKKES